MTRRPSSFDLHAAIGGDVRTCSGRSTSVYWSFRAAAVAVIEKHSVVKHFG